jgi:sigma-B regulation protein RsbU (phosphoserine phosphatase)
MACGDLLLVCFAGSEDLAARLSQSALAHWPDSLPPSMSMWDADLLWSDGARAEHPQVAWLIGAADTPVVDLYRALEALGAWQVPVILTRYDEELPIGSIFQGGVVTAPPDAQPDQLRLLVRSTLAQGELCLHLKNELKVTQLHHGGLQGQMTKLDEEMRLAARVQREFLPTSLPAVGDVAIDVMFHPASYVSGDIYDVQRLDENHIGFWIADVVGHGVPAALMTMFVKRALPTKEILPKGYRLVPPGEALTRLNAEMVNRDGGGIRFATGVYGLIDCKTYELQLARAGHPLPICLRADGTTEQMDPEGPLLGVFADDQFEQRTYRLDPGDRLLIYSDGFEVAFGEGEQTASTEYLAKFEELRNGSLDQAIHRLEQSILNQPGSLHQQDDLTLIMVGVHAPVPQDKAPTGEVGVAAS